MVLIGGNYIGNKVRTPTPYHHLHHLTLPTQASIGSSGSVAVVVGTQLTKEVSTDRQSVVVQ